MALGYTQRPRLLREDNWTAPDLAQELYAMMSPDTPDSTQAPIEMQNGYDDMVPFTLRGFSDGDTILNITRGPIDYGDFTVGGPTIGGGEIDGVNIGGSTYNNESVVGNTIINFPPITGGDVHLPTGDPLPQFSDYNVTLGDMKFAFDLLGALKDLGWVTGNNPAKLDPNAINRFLTKGGGGGGGIPGKVVSGTGTAYQVRIYLNVLGASSKVVAVTQLQIDSSDTIPVDTWVLVTKAGTSYYCQAPVWM